MKQIVGTVVLAVSLLCLSLPAYAGWERLGISHGIEVLVEDTLIFTNPDLSVDMFIMLRQDQREATKAFLPVGYTHMEIPATADFRNQILYIHSLTGVTVDGDVVEVAQETTIKNDPGLMNMLYGCVLQNLLDNGELLTYSRYTSVFGNP